jgi:starch phosphorylase
VNAATAPPDLRRALVEVAHNLAWAWLPAVRRPFQLLEPERWEATGGNPVALLHALGPHAVERRLQDPELLAALEEARAALASEIEGPTWWARTQAEEGFLVAYFSAEFGVDATLPLYSGGLGVLAGDHLKSASELGVPLVGVGLFYHEGYFRQALDAGGGQVERYPDLNAEHLPLTLEHGADGSPLEVRVDVGDESVAARVWRAQVGRTRLLLLDTDVAGNSEAARGITGRLYGGDRELRIRQELVLGVGGVRVLGALGLEPTVYHLNEGHSAFLVLERLRALRADGLDQSEAFERVRVTNVFTTHTPVPAGNEVFEADLVRRYVGKLLDEIGLPWERLLELGTAEGHPGFGMTPFALRASAYANAVSELHGSVSRGMWTSLWPGRSRDDVPIGHVTNGVHTSTWLAPELATLLRRAGVRPDTVDDEANWDAAEGLDPAELWLVHVDRRHALVAEARRRLAAAAGLNPEALTIAFARRFATYKRGGLLLSDPDRLERLLADDGRPVQILVAGKSHPADEGGKELIRRITAFRGDPRSHGRVVFLEDYDMALARFLVHGADVWLNNPRRPYEASGTSGMKSALNGGLNLSVLDGWWCEGYAPEVGWAFGGGDDAADEAEQDRRDAEELFRLLEQEVVPTFYDRGADGLPARWVAIMRASIARLGGRFGTNRMLREYVERLYLPAHRSR